MDKRALLAALGDAARRHLDPLVIVGDFPGRQWKALEVPALPEVRASKDHPLIPTLAFPGFRLARADVGFHPAHALVFWPNPHYRVPTATLMLNLGFKTDFGELEAQFQASPDAHTRIAPDIVARGLTRGPGRELTEDCLYHFLLAFDSYRLRMKSVFPDDHDRIRRLIAASDNPSHARILYP